MNARRGATEGVEAVGSLFFVFCFFFENASKKSHHEEIWGEMSSSASFWLSVAKTVPLIQAGRHLVASECLQASHAFAPPSPLDAGHRLPDADILQMLDGRVNRCRETLRL